jgi:hypothetical protein
MFIISIAENLESINFKMARTGDRRVAYRILVGKRKRKGPLGRLRPRWEYNIKMNLKLIGTAWI